MMMNSLILIRHNIESISVSKDLENLENRGISMFIVEKS